MEAKRGQSLLKGDFVKELKVVKLRLASVGKGRLPVLLRIAYLIYLYA